MATPPARTRRRTNRSHETRSHAGAPPPPPPVGRREGPTLPTEPDEILRIQTAAGVVPAVRTCALCEEPQPAGLPYRIVLRCTHGEPN